MIENFKLHVFRVVADTLNFSKAPEELHLSQPAFTSQVRSLEEGLSCRIPRRKLCFIWTVSAVNRRLILAVFHRRQRRGVSRIGRRWNHSLQTGRHCHRVHGSLSYAHLPTKQMKPNPEPLFSQFKSALRRIAGLGYVLNWRLQGDVFIQKGAEGKSAFWSFVGERESAGLNRHVVGDARALQERK